MDVKQNHKHAVKDYTCTKNQQLCVRSVRSNLYPTSYISHQKLCKHAGPFQHRKNCDNDIKKNGQRWLTQSVFPKGQCGQVKRRPWWYHRKEEQGQLEKGQPDDRTHTHTHPSPQCRRPFSHGQRHLRVKHSLHATVSTASMRKKENLLHIFVLSGTDWLQVLSNNVGNAESFFQFSY